MSQSLGDKRDTVAALSRARGLLEALARERPREIKVRRDLADCLGLSGALLSELGRFDEALEANRADCAIRREIVDLRPEDPESRRGLGMGLGNLANSYSKAENHVLALATYRLALEQQEIQARLHPDQLVDRNYLAMTLHNMSSSNMDDAGAERLASLERALAIRRGLVAATPENAYFARNVARTLTRLGVLIGRHRSRPVEALAMLDEACDTLRRVTRIEPVNLAHRRDLAEAIGGRVEALVRLGRPSEALDASKEGFALLAELARADPENQMSRRILADFQNPAAAAHEALCQIDEAIRLRKARLAMLQGLVAAHPDSKNFRDDLAAEVEAIRRLSAGSPTPDPIGPFPEEGDREPRNPRSDPSNRERP